jgi:hypothetical protein
MAHRGDDKRWHLSILAGNSVPLHHPYPVADHEPAAGFLLDRDMQPLAGSTPH